MNLTNIINPPLKQELTKTSIEVIERLTEKIRIEREAYEASSSVTLRNGKVLDLDEQMEFFKKVYELAVFKEACGKVEKFKTFFQLKQFYNAWSLLLANINWLTVSYIMSVDDLPENINVEIDYFDRSGKIESITFGESWLDDTVIFYESGLARETINRKDDNSIIACYFEDGHLNTEYKY